MDTDSTVSVIIPCYNAPETLQQTIGSVLRQTYVNIEVVLIDDGSTDDTLQRLEGFDDPRITVLSNEENCGIPVTRNKGLRESEGEYVCFLDQDDVWLSRKLEIQLEVIHNNPEIGVVYSSHYLLDKSGRPFGLRASDPATDGHKNLALKCYHSKIIFPNPTKLYRRDCFDAVGYLDESLYGSDDHDLDIRILSETDYSYKHIDTPLAFKRQIETNSGQNFEQMSEDELSLAEKHAHLFSNPNQEESKKKSQILADRGLKRARQGRIVDSVIDLGRSIRYDPTNPCPYLFLTAFVPGKLRDWWFRVYDYVAIRRASQINWGPMVE